LFLLNGYGVLIIALFFMASKRKITQRNSGLLKKRR